MDYRTFIMDVKRVYDYNDCNNNIDYEKTKPIYLII